MDRPSSSSDTFSRRLIRNSTAEFLIFTARRAGQAMRRVTRMRPSGWP